jgi:hypothetical protein
VVKIVPEFDYSGYGCGGVVEACIVPKGSVFTKINALTTKMLAEKLAKNSFLCTVSPHK